MRNVHNGQKLFFFKLHLPIRIWHDTAINCFDMDPHMFCNGVGRVNVNIAEFLNLECIICDC